MVGARQKAAGDLTGHGERTELEVVTHGALEVPSLPDNVTTPEAREHWQAIWTSTIARYWEPASDHGGLVRYIQTFDAWVKARVIGTKAPLVKGAAGQMRPNPIEATITRLAHELRSLETRYGLTPKDRIGLGIDITAGLLAGKSLERELEAAAEEVEASMDEIDPEWLADD